MLLVKCAQQACLRSAAGCSVCRPIVYFSLWLKQACTLAECELLMKLRGRVSSRLSSRRMNIKYNNALVADSECFNWEKG